MKSPKKGTSLAKVRTSQGGDADSNGGVVSLTPKNSELCGTWWEGVCHAGTATKASVRGFVTPRAAAKRLQPCKLTLRAGSTSKPRLPPEQGASPKYNVCMTVTEFAALNAEF